MFKLSSLDVVHAQELTHLTGGIELQTNSCILTRKLHWPSGVLLQVPGIVEKRCEIGMIKVIEHMDFVCTTYRL